MVEGFYTLTQPLCGVFLPVHKAMKEDQAQFSLSVPIVVGWPSGLRRWFKAPVISMAWVRIPPLPVNLFSFYELTSFHLYCLQRSAVSAMEGGSYREQLITIIPHVHVQVI